MGEAKQEEVKAETKPEERKEEKQEGKAEEKKEEAEPSPPPPVVLSMDLHCVGCAKKIERSILKCRGVEEVMVDMVQNQITVKGIVEPQALCNRIQKKTMRKVRILSPLPPAEGDSKPEVVVNSQQVSGLATVELRVNMHCEACTQQLQRKILKMRGVRSVETNLSSGMVTVTGTMNGDKIVEYIHRRTGKLASIIPPPPKEEEKKEEGEKKGKEKLTEEKKEEKVEEKEEEKAPQQQEGNREGDKKDGEEKGGSEEQKKEGEVMVTTNNMVSEEDMVKRMVYWNGGIFTEEEMARRMMMHRMPVYFVERPPPPPQLFSDENPNACCIS